MILVTLAAVLNIIINIVIIVVVDCRMQDGWLVKLALLFCVWRKSAAAPPDEMRVSKRRCHSHLEP